VEKIASVTRAKPFPVAWIDRLLLARYGQRPTTTRRGRATAVDVSCSGVLHMRMLAANDETPCEPSFLSKTATGARTDGSPTIFETLFYVRGFE
jgi:hypothetical protein